MKSLLLTCASVALLLIASDAAAQLHPRQVGAFGRPDRSVMANRSDLNGVDLYLAEEVLQLGQGLTWINGSISLDAGAGADGVVTNAAFTGTGNARTLTLTRSGDLADLTTAFTLSSLDATTLEGFGESDFYSIRNPQPSMGAGTLDEVLTAGALSLQTAQFGGLVLRPAENNSTTGYTALQLYFTGDATRNTMGSLRSSSNWYMGYGVGASPAVVDGFISTEATSVRAASIIGRDGFEIRTAPSGLVAVDADVTMPLRFRVDPNGSILIPTLSGTGTSVMELTTGGQLARSTATYYTTDNPPPGGVTYTRDVTKNSITGSDGSTISVIPVTSRQKIIATAGQTAFAFTAPSDAPNPTLVEISRNGLVELDFGESAGIWTWNASTMTATHATQQLAAGERVTIEYKKVN